MSKEKELEDKIMSKEKELEDKIKELTLQLEELKNKKAIQKIIALEDITVEEKIKYFDNHCMLKQIL